VNGFLTAPNRNILTYLLTYLLTYRRAKVLQRRRSSGGNVRLSYDEFLVSFTNPKDTIKANIRRI